MHMKLLSLGLAAAVLMTCVSAETTSTGQDAMVNHAFANKRGLSVPVKVATAIRRRALARRGEEADEEEAEEDEGDEEEDDETEGEDENANVDDEETESEVAGEEEEIIEDSEEGADEQEEGSGKWKRIYIVDQPPIRNPTAAEYGYGDTTITVGTGAYIPIDGDFVQIA